jgi:hypothetical protein
MDRQVGAPVSDREVRLPRTTGVKNKQPAAVQITAEQLLRESKALQGDEFKPAKVTITDPQELAGKETARKAQRTGAFSTNKIRSLHVPENTKFAEEAPTSWVVVLDASCILLHSICT